jgi:hypothetical protein
MWLGGKLRSDMPYPCSLPLFGCDRKMTTQSEYFSRSSRRPHLQATSWAARELVLIRATLPTIACPLSTILPCHNMHSSKRDSLHHPESATEGQAYVSRLSGVAKLRLKRMPASRSNSDIKLPVIQGRAISRRKIKHGEAMPPKSHVRALFPVFMRRTPSVAWCRESP